MPCWSLRLCRALDNFAARASVGALVCALCCCVPAAPEALRQEPGQGRHGHLSLPPVPPEPDVVAPAPVVPAELPLYHLDVANVPARELVWALVRDASVAADLEYVPDAKVTLYAPAQPLSALLERIVALAGWRMDVSPGGQLLFAADEPYVRMYQVGYLDMARSSSSHVRVATQIKAPSGGDDGVFADNNSTTDVSSDSMHDFWSSLEANLQALAGDGDVVMNAAAGVVMVRARDKVQQQVSGFLRALQAGAHRQVLIEATIVEVSLDDSFRAGVNWSFFEGSNFSVKTEGLAPSEGSLVLQYDNKAPGFALSSVLRLLRRFGDTEVLSSPRLMALNNQTAVLKVVDNLVYFTVNQQTTLSVQGNSETTASSEVHTVPVGLVMSITPHIDSAGAVILSVRPSVSRINGFVDDPNPALSGSRGNRVPQVRVRELESLLRLEDGQVAVLGGLMQEQTEETENSVPWLSGLPLVGRAFVGTERRLRRTELVILLRPVVLRTAQEEAACCA